MRELTKKEKTIVTTLVQKYQPNSTLTIGEILMELYQIKAIRKYEPTESELHYFSEKELSQVRVEYEHDPQKDFSVDFYEAILLICYLIDNNYLIINYSPFTNNTIGEFSKIMHSGGSVPKIQNFYDVFPYKIWSLLNGTFIVTNALIDFAKDFKTIEQRRFEEQMDDTQAKHKEAMRIANRTLRCTQLAFFVALISTLSTFTIGIFEKKDMTIRELNNTIKEKNIPEVVETKLRNDTIKAIIISQPESNSNKSVKKRSPQK